ncbi:MAG: ABC transporter [Gammaproteobacteria bacterium]|nr:MAG: ABC transporter [Gammaproteobacteria bacterium]
MVNDSILRRVSAVLLFMLVILIAAAIYWWVLKWDRQFDWTQTQGNTLSSSSVAVLAEINDSLSVTAYTREQNSAVRKAITRLVERYRRYKPDIDLSFVDTDAEPQRVRDLNIKVDGEMVLQLGDASEHVKSLREQSFSNALQRLLRQGDRWLAFVSGHGERKPEGKANHDIQNWVNELKEKGFNIANVNLSETGGVPNNAAMLIIAGSQLNWLPGEVDHVIKYIDRGGNLLWLVDPGSDYGLSRLAEYLTLSIDGATVIDPLARLVGIDNPTFAIVANYPKHPLWEQFEATTLFPQITAVTPLADAKDWRQDIILRSGDQSWLERGDLAGNVRLGDDDLAGPIPLAVSLQRQFASGESYEKAQRVVVLGDGDFIANQYIGNAGNLGLGLRLINWLSENDNLIAIPTPERGDRELILSFFESQLIAVGFLIAIPALLLLTGMLIWWRRRRRS